MLTYNEKYTPNAELDKLYQDMAAAAEPTTEAEWSLLIYLSASYAHPRSYDVEAKCEVAK